MYGNSAFTVVQHPWHCDSLPWLWRPFPQSHHQASVGLASVARISQAVVAYISDSLADRDQREATEESGVAIYFGLQTMWVWLDGRSLLSLVAKSCAGPALCRRYI